MSALLRIVRPGDAVDHPGRRLDWHAAEATDGGTRSARGGALMPVAAPADKRFRRAHVSPRASADGGSPSWWTHRPRRRHRASSSGSRCIAPSDLVLSAEALTVTRITVQRQRAACRAVKCWRCSMGCRGDQHGDRRPRKLAAEAARRRRGWRTRRSAAMFPGTLAVRDRRASADRHRPHPGTALPDRPAGHGHRRVRSQLRRVRSADHRRSGAARSRRHAVDGRGTGRAGRPPHERPAAASRSRRAASRRSTSPTSHDAIVLLKDDTALLRVGDEHFTERLQSYLDLMPALRERMPDIDYVDLRFDERVYVRPQSARPRTSARHRSRPRTAASGRRRYGAAARSGRSSGGS